MKNSAILALLIAVLCAACVVRCSAQNSILRSIYLVDAYNRSASSLHPDADGFHLILNGIHLGDLDDSGYYDNGYLQRNVYESTDGVHIDWTYGSTVKGDYDTFGFTVDGPAQFSSCQMWFTANSTTTSPITIWTIEDMWQDWTMPAGSVIDTLNNRTGYTRYTRRTAGRSTSLVDINDLVGMTTPTLPIILDAGYTPMANGASLAYNFAGYPGNSTYFMFYEHDAYVSGAYETRAKFRTAAVLTPASLTFSANKTVPDKFWWPGSTKTDNEMLSFNVTAGSGDHVVWSSVTLQPTGYGDDGMDIAAVKVWLDNNNNGVVDAGDTLIGSGYYAFDDSATTIYLTSAPDIAANGTVHALISYTMAGTGWSGADYTVSLTDASGTGGASGAEAAVYGLSIDGAPLTEVNNPSTIQAIKQQSSVDTTFLQDKIVTGYFSGTGTDASDIVYVEDDARACGIGIAIPAQDSPIASVGDRISVNGLALTGNPELYLFGMSWLVGAHATPLKPLAITGKSSGGGAYGLQGAVLNDATAVPTVAARGLNSVGLLVKLNGSVTGTGQMTWGGATHDVVWIDDGSGLKDGLTVSGGALSQGIAVLLPIGTTVPANGSNLAAVGIMSAMNGPTRLLLPRTAADIRQF